MYTLLYVFLSSRSKVPGRPVVHLYHCCEAYLARPLQIDLCMVFSALFQTMLQYFNPSLSHFAHVWVYLSDKFPEGELPLHWVHAFLTVINTAKLSASKAVPIATLTRNVREYLFPHRLANGVLARLLIFVNPTGENATLVLF